MQRCCCRHPRCHHLSRCRWESWRMRTHVVEENVLKQRKLLCPSHSQRRRTKKRKRRSGSANWVSASQCLGKKVFAVELDEEQKEKKEKKKTTQKENRKKNMLQQRELK